MKDYIINELKVIGERLENIIDELEDYDLNYKAQTCSYHIFNLTKAIIAKTLKVGDEIVTSDGIHAIVIGKSEDSLMINGITEDGNGAYEPITLNVETVTMLKATGKRFEIREVEES